MAVRFDEEGRKIDRSFAPANLKDMSIAELEAYIEALKAEITRVEGDIKSKADHLNALDSVFGKRG